MRTCTDRISVIDIDYNFWIEDNEKDVLSVKSLEYNPKISIVVPIYNANENVLKECIESVIAQTYKNWELILVDDASTLESVRQLLAGYADNEKIEIIYRSENGNISVATNDGIKIAKGEFIGFLDNDDLLSPNALYEVASKLNENRELAFIYSDEDKISEDGTRRTQPFFKPDWSPDTLLSYNYCNHFSVYRRDMMEQTGYLRSEFNGAQDYDFVLRFTENCKSDRIGHIPKILYHWRESATSTAAGNENKSYVREASKSVKEEALKRRKVLGHTEWIEDAKEYRIVYDTPGNPLVSIIILSKDNLPILRQCIDSIEKLTRYKNYEIIVVDNGSANKDEVNEYLRGRAEYIYQPMDFNFSAQCNMGAKVARGEYILLLNDDIEIIQPDWLDRLLGQAMQPHSGAVGAKLYYPHTKSIQHAGVINILPGPSHALSLMDDDEIYYFGRNRLTYNYMAITGACMMCSKDKYFEVGGLDESLPVAYNDIDFCMTFCERGYYNVLRNDVTAYHYESLSRGYDALDTKKKERLIEESKFLLKKHRLIRFIDGFYNQNLTQRDIDFSVDVDEECHVSDRRRVLSHIRGKKCAYSMHIDRVINAETMKIEGWSTSGNYDKDENAVRSLLLKLRSDYILEVDVFPKRREDLPKVLDSDALNNGFVAMIDTSLFKGEARDYLFGIKYKYNGDTTYSWSETMLNLVEDDSRFGFANLKSIGTRNRRVFVRIENVKKMSDVIYIAGWSFHKGDRRHLDYYHRYLAVKIGNEIKKIRTRVVYRGDLAERIFDFRNVLYSGFEALVPYREMDENIPKKWYMVYEDLRTNKVWHKEIFLSEYGL